MDLKYFIVLLILVGCVNAQETHLPTTLTKYSAGASTGNIASFYAIDGDTYNITEDNANPPLAFELGFTGISDQEDHILSIYGVYIGSTAPEMWIQIYNNTANDYTDVAEVLFESGIYEQNITIDSDFIMSGVVNVKFNHTSAGNVNHYLDIDKTVIETTGAETGSTQYVFLGSLNDALYSVDVCTHSDGCITYNQTNDSFGRIIIPLNSTRDYIFKVKPSREDILNLDFIKRFTQNTMANVMLILFLLVLVFYFVNIVSGLGGRR